MNLKTIRRRAISPVLATVILIAITLIAAIAIAGFVFGLFGTFTSTARISANVVTCSHNLATVGLAYCEITLTNSGNAAATAEGCSFTGTNGGGAGTLSASPTAIAAETPSVTTTTPVTAYCVAAVGTTAGTEAAGAVTLSNGGSALFSGTFQ